MTRWLQSAGLQHLASPLTSADNRALTTLVMQDYGGQSAEERQNLLMLFRNLNFNGEPGLEPYTPSHGLGGGGSSSVFSSELRGEFGAGLLDLHSIDDTELISEHTISESFEPSPFMPSSSLDDEFGAVASKPQKGLADSSSRLSTAEKEHSGKESNISKIKVVVRKRPLNKKEISRREDDVVTVNDSTRLTVHEPKLKVDLTAYVEKHEFCFDSVLSEDVTNDEVYRITVEPIISAIFQQTKATCFAYGQTGSGKTFTMQPLPLRASEDMLRLLHQPVYRNQRFKMWLSYFEIYGGKLYDLLSDRRKLCMREDGRQQVCIVGLQEFEVSDPRIVREYIEKGNAARSTGSTGANEESSRSHAILQLVIKKHVEANGSKRHKEVNEAKNSKVIGKISFIDLAGSERGADTTDNDRQTRIEGAEINKSLLALKECIRALDNDQIHIPFRGSKLTEVLRDSFVGNSRTVMISCISPNAGSCEHTLNTLRYADRVKSLSRSGNPKKDQPSTSSVPLGKEASPALSFPLPTVLEDMHEQNQEPITVEVRTRIPEATPASSTSDMDRRLTNVTSSYNPPGRDESGTTSSLGDRVDVKHVFGYQAGHKSYSAQNLPDNQEENKVPKVSPPEGKSAKRDSGLDFPTTSHKQQQQQQATIDYDTRNVTTRQYDEEAPYDEMGINAILEEEEALIAAHRKEIEDTMEIVREEMKLLAEVDQPGSLIDDYVTRLSYILSRKVAGLVGLQARLTRFQHRLKEQDILSNRRKVHH
ncbi:unnamed protein product [Spirodela intermedia]|uniref:Kinesin-like protein n=1 Tax=Spirodela intermedia TaxID=51605 RepID=A0A7I8IZP9_SPIIN|nr:unnamed protein product [Spirodela intermedia]CAA6663444.1 unnamed protein product [Spirodela intermedia]